MGTTWRTYPGRREGERGEGWTPSFIEEGACPSPGEREQLRTNKGTLGWAGSISGARQITSDYLPAWEGSGSVC